MRRRVSTFRRRSRFGDTSPSMKPLRYCTRPNPVYALSRLGQTPNIRQGRKVYFTEEELLKYIYSGRIVTTAEIQAEAAKALYKRRAR